jgi:hypothetical protein
MHAARLDATATRRISHRAWRDVQRPAAHGLVFLLCTGDLVSKSGARGCKLRRAAAIVAPRAPYCWSAGLPLADEVFVRNPDDTRATKLTVTVLPAEDADATDLRWFSEAADIRNDAGVAEELLAFIDAAGARSIVITDRIIGCPHEEGID